MEPQEQKIYCYCNKEKKGCIGIAVAIFFVAFAFTIGLIIGASLSEAVLGALSAVIILAIVLFILFIVSLILKYCKKRC